MNARLIRGIWPVLCVVFAATALAQEGHPLKGTWVGEWGPTSAQRHRVVLVMDWDGKQVTGALNPGVDSISLKMTRLDITPGNPNREAAGRNSQPKPGVPESVPTFKVHIEAEGKDAQGNTVTIVADGPLEDIGIPSRWIAGTWVQTSGGRTERGDFKIRRE